MTLLCNVKVPCEMLHMLQSSRSFTCLAILPPTSFTFLHIAHSSGQILLTAWRSAVQCCLSRWEQQPLQEGCLKMTWSSCSGTHIMTRIQSVTSTRASWRTIQAGSWIHIYRQQVLPHWECQTVFGYVFGSLVISHGKVWSHWLQGISSFNIWIWTPEAGLTWANCI